MLAKSGVSMDVEKAIVQDMGDGKFHKGFYNLGLDYLQNGLIAIKNPWCNFEDDEDDMPGFVYAYADVFWMGSCQLFSLALHRELGLDAYELRGEDDRLIHAFCKSSFRGIPSYVDVRGETTDFSEFLFRLVIYNKEKVCCVPQDVDNDFLTLTNDEKEGYKFALDIIKCYRGYYGPIQSNDV